MTPAEVAALGGGGADGTQLNGNGAPAANTGINGDTYRDDQTGAQYKKASGAWSAILYEPAQPSDAFPANTDVAAAGAGTDFTREGHDHGVLVSKAVDFHVNIGAGHDTTDSAAYHLQGNIWRALRAGALHDFSQWVAPDAVTIYRGHVGLLTKNGDSDYTLDEDTIQSSATATAPGNTAHQLDFGFTSELHFEKDDYFLVAVATGSADADGRQQANPLISQTVGLLDYITHAKLDAAPTAGDNVWHMNPTNQGYRQRLGIVATSVDELVIEKDGATVYSGPNLWDVTDPEGQVVAGDAKVLLTLYPERIIVSETEPPDPADVDDGDLGKMYFHVNADGVIKSVSYIREVDPRTYSHCPPPRTRLQGRLRLVARTWTPIMVTSFRGATLSR